MHAFNLQSCEYWGIGMREPRNTDWKQVSLSLREETAEIHSALRKRLSSREDKEY